MRILIHANAPWVATGYGVQCGLLAERLKADGHDVAISSTYGQQGNMGTWRGIPVYPAGYETNGNDILHNHALHWFGGDPLGGWIVTLLDVWCLQNPLLADFNIAAWCPVDHLPAPQGVTDFFRRTAAVPVAMSRFGEGELRRAGLNPYFVPLAVDTKAFRPRRSILVGDREVTGRELLGLPEQAFVVGMVAMNKGWARDRKGFNEAFRAFSMFWSQHDDAVLYVHADWAGGAEGINLAKLALHAGIPEHALVWVNQYAYRFGFPPEQMAAVYSAMDVLLAPSHGEGFCVPLIEAQACGTPVIATDFSSQRELVGSGWRVKYQPEWDPAQGASYACPDIPDIYVALEECYRSDLNAMAVEAVEFAGRYDADRVYASHWRPLLDLLDRPAEILPLEREPMTDCAIVIPVMRRPDNAAKVMASVLDGKVYAVADPDDTETIAAWEAAGATVIVSDRGTSYAAKVNCGYEQTTEPWLFVCGDDVEFTPGCFAAAAKLTDRFDVIGTNDSAGQPKNPDVAAGLHADHFFVRRAYVDEYGACLDGPGVLAPECYRHWFTDKEIVGLAKARGVFAPCLDSVVIHHHPGYDGREDLRRADPVYMLPLEHRAADEATWEARRPLVEMQRTSLAKVR